MTNQPTAPTNTLAALSLAVAVAAPAVGLALGVVARAQVATSGERGRRLATAGIVVNSVLLLVQLLFGVAILLGWGLAVLVYLGLASGPM